MTTEFASITRLVPELAAVVLEALAPEPVALTLKVEADIGAN